MPRAPAGLPGLRGARLAVGGPLSGPLLGWPRPARHHGGMPDAALLPAPADLSIEQKAALCLGSDFWRTAPVEAAGVESIMVSDGPHGLRKQPDRADHAGISGSLPATCFPTASALASSWDSGLLREVGAAIGAEARAQGVAVVLGPGVNIKRSPLCGRNFEYFSEDPFLTGRLAAAMVTGLQSQQVGASVKHFAANNQETDRVRVSADVDERTLREIYLPAFEHVVTTAAPWTVMCAYNKLNGEYCSQHRWLLTDVLRGEWGFDGVVVSDWGAVADRVAAPGRRRSARPSRWPPGPPRCRCRPARPSPSGWPTRPAARPCAPRSAPMRTAAPGASSAAPRCSRSSATSRSPG